MTLGAPRGTNVREPASRRGPDREGVDGVGGGEVKPRLFEGCVRVGGWGMWTGEAMA